jgi:hypothetical protein
MPQTIASLEGFTRKIAGVSPAGGEVLLYRGHASHLHKLNPSVLRDPKYRNDEHTILRELVASHPEEFASDRSTLEQLARMQHYSLPTRLLDATWNPLVALYFATKDEHDIAGDVVVLRVRKDKVKYFDSDTASCVANLAHLHEHERQAIDFSLTGSAFNQQRPIDRLLQFIRTEKPYFRAEIEPTDLRTVHVVKPKHNSARIIAQAGAFLLFGITDALDVKPVPGIVVDTIRINGKQKDKISRELDRMGFNDSTMFPEIEKAALYIRSRL